jgi:hypothetical protein
VRENSALFGAKVPSRIAVRRDGERAAAAF